MKSLLSLFFILMLAASVTEAKSKKRSASKVSKDPLSRQQLLKGLKVPEPRAFRESPRYQPCQDFHLYACAEVENKYRKLSDTGEIWTFSFTDAEKKTEYARAQFLRRLYAFTPRQDRDQQVKTHFRACMSAEGIGEAKKLLNEERATVSKIKNSVELAQLSQSRLDSGRWSFHQLVVVSKVDNPAVKDVFLNSRGFTLPDPALYKNEELLKDYQELLKEFFKEISLDKASQRAQWVVDFEKELAAVTPSGEEREKRIRESKSINRADFLARYPHFQMERILNLLPQTTVLLNPFPEAHDFLQKALQEKPIEQLKSVYLWHVMMMDFDESLPGFAKSRWEFEKKHLEGPRRAPTREQRCIAEATRFFEAEIDSILVEKLFPDVTFDSIKDLSQKIRLSAIRTLEGNDWMSSSSKKKALQRLQELEFLVGVPEADEQWNFLPVEKYKIDQPLANRYLYRKAQLQKSLQSLSGTPVKGLWTESPLWPKVTYKPLENQILIPVALFQFPIYQPKASEPKNAGAIGVLIAHELARALEVRPHLWGSDKDLRRYREQGHDFEKQFSKLGHDGQKTLSENMADHVGLKMAYDAIFTSGAAPLVSSLAVKRDFFISYAKMYCTVSHPAAQQRFLQTSRQAWPHERINQQLMHMPAFYEAFQCEPTDRMYLPESSRIQVW